MANDDLDNDGPVDDVLDRSHLDPLPEERPYDDCLPEDRALLAELIEGPADAGRTYPVTIPPRPGGRANGSITMAAMIGISEALGFDKRQEQVAEASASSGEGIDLDFGDLPPLD